MKKIPLELEETAHGVIVPVKAKPAAHKNGIVGFFAGALRVAVTTAPEKGKANKAIIKVLAKEFGISRKYISLKSGDISTDKKFLITSLTAADLLSLLSSLGIV